MAGCIFYDENALKGSRSSENLIAHEIVHQWFGNSATEKDWPHLWLSEGFATYLTNIYIEQTKGTEAFQTQLRKDRIRVLAFEKKYKHPVIDTSYTSLMNLLNPNSYQKGAWVLHMLRTEIGDSLFHLSIQKYYQTYFAYGYATSLEFISSVEETTEMDLTEFFNDWLFNEGYPSYVAEWGQPSNELQIILSQSTSHESVDFFEGLITVRVIGESGEVLDLVLEHNYNNQIYINDVGFNVSSLEINPTFDQKTILFFY